MRWPNYADDQANVQKFYNDRDDELAWTRDGKPTDAAMALLKLFQDAAQKGLNPEDYDADAAGEGRWAARLKRLAAIAKKKDDSEAAQDAVAQFDVAMTISAMRYLEDLHVGRMNPQALNFDIDMPQKRAAFDVATLLNDQRGGCRGCAAGGRERGAAEPDLRADGAGAGGVSGAGDGAGCGAVASAAGAAERGEAGGRGRRVCGGAAALGPAAV